MESIAAFDLVASLGSVVDIVTTFTETLNDARTKYAGIELKAELLVGQFRTVRTALTQARGFAMEISLQQQTQFTVELKRSVDHCKLLAQHVDEQVSRLDGLSDDLLAGSFRAETLLDERMFWENIQNLVSHVAALNICLTAFRCDAKASQLVGLDIVELPVESDIFELPVESELVELPVGSSLVELPVESDPVELPVESNIVELPDGSSIVELPVPDEETDEDETATIKLGERLMAITGPVDLPSFLEPRTRDPAAKTKKLTLHRLFLRPRSLGSPRRPPGQANASGHAPIIGSGAILKDTTLSPRLSQSVRAEDRQLRILAMGQDPPATIKRLRFALSHPPTNAELAQERLEIVPYLVRALLSLSKSLDTPPLTEQNMLRLACTQELEFFESDGSPDWIVSQSIYRAALSLYQDFLRMIDQEAPGAYFVKATPRIMHPHFIPSQADIIRHKSANRCVTEAKFVIDGISVELFDVPQPKLARFIRHHEDVDALLFCLDLSTYDMYPKGSQHNQVEVALRELKARCRSRKLSNTPVLVLLRNSGSFRRKLVASPLHNHFPSCTRKPKSYDEALIWLQKHVKDHLQTSQTMLLHCAYDDTDDDSIISFFEESVIKLSQILASQRTMNELIDEGILSPPSNRKQQKIHYTIKIAST
ncbi:Guanine nucleotide-binding protein alpha-16 subunit [Cyphellophora attinorum]|uniref:Guanine nucleotide-binding protein alpha-16 subunit n=1 Tax=Cyphellophora attinorum TaxID=1664694 RepID=A0A0N1HXK2_9EURO|nr:Guanine nucleotide-binding protein alpha-16 subunit [Phialophora attinorum]KPI45300.1 Guanine nucleotide-binding protein alpha-16 subunit [Phialophora attinorum]